MAVGSQNWQPFLRPGTRSIWPSIELRGNMHALRSTTCPEDIPTILPRLTHPCLAPRAGNALQKRNCVRKGAAVGQPAATAQTARLCGTIMTRPHPAQRQPLPLKKRQGLPCKKEPRRGRGSVRKNLLPCPDGAKHFKLS